MHPSRKIIIVPAHNEANNLSSTIEDIISSTDMHIVVVDDASTDNTVYIARKAGATVLPLTSRLGAWGATQAGLRYALKRGYDTAITFDADGQHRACEIAPMLEKQQVTEADLVIGSCTSRGSYARHIAWILLRLLSRLDVKDLTSGLRAYSRRSMEVVARKEATSLDYQDIGVLVFLRRAGLSITETNVCILPRADGKSRIFNSWFSVGKYMIYSIILSLSNTTLKK